MRVSREANTGARHNTATKHEDNQLAMPGTRFTRTGAGTLHAGSLHAHLMLHAGAAALPETAPLGCMHIPYCCAIRGKLPCALPCHGDTQHKAQMTFVDDEL